MRVPAPFLPTGNKPLTASDLKGFFDFLRASPLFGAALIEGIATPASTSPSYSAHGLGRRFRGAIVVGQDPSTLTLRVMSPDEVEAAGQDPTKVFGLRPSANTATTANVVVF